MAILITPPPFDRHHVVRDLAQMPRLLQRQMNFFLGQRTAIAALQSVDDLPLFGGQRRISGGGVVVMVTPSSLRQVDSQRTMTLAERAGRLRAEEP